LFDDELWCAYPFLEGFSFYAKKWGEISVNDLTPIAFDDTAFEKLVIPQDKKILISALVRFQDKAFTDIISGKGGGCIFLLHGSPGVGKTLTAESIAELMRRPLYRYQQISAKAYQYFNTSCQHFSRRAGYNPRAARENSK